MFFTTASGARSDCPRRDDASGCSRSPSASARPSPTPARSTAGFLSSATAFSHGAGFIRSLRGKPRHQMSWCATRNMLTSFAQLYAPETAGRRSSQRAHHRERVARDPRMIRYDAAVTFVRGSREFSLSGDTGESAISFPRPRAIPPHRRRSTCAMAKVRGNVCCLSKTGDPGLEFAYATHFV